MLSDPAVVPCKLILPMNCSCGRVVESEATEWGTVILFGSSIHPSIHHSSGKLVKRAEGLVSTSLVMLLVYKPGSGPIVLKAQTADGVT